MNVLSRLVLVTAATLTVIACSEQNSARSTTTERPAYSKPSAPTELLTQGSYRADIGDEIVIPVTLRTRSGHSLTVELQPDEGLDLVYPRGPVQLSPDENGTATLEAVIRTPAQGRHYLGIYASSGTVDAGMSRSFSIAVQVGTPTVKPKVNRVDPGTENIRRMPAEESTL